MSLALRGLFYVLDVLFWLWVVRWEGAEWLERTFTSGFLIHFVAPRWSTEGIKLFGEGALILSTIWFVLGLFYSELKF
jgi:hypothetical protein